MTLSSLNSLYAWAAIMRSPKGSSPYPWNDSCRCARRIRMYPAAACVACHAGPLLHMTFAVAMTKRSAEARRFRCGRQLHSDADETLPALASAGHCWEQTRGRPTAGLAETRPLAAACNITSLILFIRYLETSRAANVFCYTVKLAHR